MTTPSSPSPAPSPNAQQNYCDPKLAWAGLVAAAIACSAMYEWGAARGLERGKIEGQKEVIEASKKIGSLEAELKAKNEGLALVKEVIAYKDQRISEFLALNKEQEMDIQSLRLKVGQSDACTYIQNELNRVSKSIASLNKSKNEPDFGVIFQHAPDPKKIEERNKNIDKEIDGLTKTQLALSQSLSSCAGK